MIPLRRLILLQTYKALDLMIMAVSFLFGACILSSQTHNIPIAEFLSMRVKLQNIIFFVGFLGIWHISFTAFGLYQSRRFSTPRAEIKDVFMAVSVGTLVISIAGFLLRISILTPQLLVGFWVTNFTMSSVTRLILRWILNRIRTRGRNLRYLLIVGTNPRAVRFAEKIESKAELGYRIVGFVDEDWYGIADFKKTKYELTCDFHSFPDVIRGRVVDEVVIALPLKSNYQRSSQIAALCEEQGIITRFLPDIFSSNMSRVISEDLEEYPMISHYTGAMDGWRVLVKRMFDISFSLIFLFITAPLFLFAAFLIKCTSLGPAFFVQKRIGINKRSFCLYKFRTMHQDAEKKLSELEDLNEASGPVFKIKDDPRITPIGKFLRKTSIDELPQLFNVLKGDMSLVGPRPLPVRDYEGFDQDWHRRRFSVPPGITCLWQINGRHALPFEKWMELDMEYIDSWSLWLDIKILVKTIPAAILGSGAS